MQRVVFHHPQKIPGAYMRLRNEGAGKITCTYKQESKTGDILSMQELETMVGNLEEMRSIFLALGILEKAYQETYREIWKIGDVECMIDEWPGLSPFIEIEGPTQK
jgi:adenylate cyclase, class 2